jgi:hypothetical protein
MNTHNPPQITRANILKQAMLAVFAIAGCVLFVLLTMRLAPSVLAQGGANAHASTAVRHYTAAHTFSYPDSVFL